MRSEETLVTSVWSLHKALIVYQQMWVQSPTLWRIYYKVVILHNDVLFFCHYVRTITHWKLKEAGRSLSEGLVDSRTAVNSLSTLRWLPLIIAFIRRNLFNYLNHQTFLVYSFDYYFGTEDCSNVSVYIYFVYYYHCITNRRLSLAHCCLLYLFHMVSEHYF